MKRLLTAVLLIAVALSLTRAVQAAPYSPGGPYLKTEQLKWVTHKLTAGTGEILTNDQLSITSSCVACRIDSVEFNRLAATGATQSVAQVETTTALNTSRWSGPPMGVGVGDSTFMGRVIFSDAGAHGAGDSLIIGIQVSVDGLNWNYVNPIKDVAGANPVLATDIAATGFVLLEQGGNGGAFSFPFTKGICGTLPDRYNIWQWPWVRFIVINEHAATVHNLNVHVVHWAID